MVSLNGCGHLVILYMILGRPFFADPKNGPSPYSGGKGKSYEALPSPSKPESVKPLGAITLTGQLGPASKATYRTKQSKEKTLPEFKDLTLVFGKTMLVANKSLVTFCQSTQEVRSTH